MRTVLLFTEFLASNSISYRVIMNYISALKHMFTRYGWDGSVFSAPILNSLLQSIKLSFPLTPTPKATLTLRELREISRLCDQFDCPQVYRTAFLLGFYALLRISNIAPPFQRSFDPSRHLLRGDVKFIYPGAHLKLKWAKNIQAPEKVHWIKIPTMSDSLLCPVTALQ